MYADEVSLAAIAHRDSRKFWAVYISFLELGPLLLPNENSWLTICTTETVALKHVAASLGQLVKAILLDLFLGAHDPQLAGIRLETNGTHYRLFVKLGMLLCDGGAHQALWSAALHGGHKLCMLCSNVYSRKSGLSDEAGAEVLVCNGECFTTEDCDLMSNQEMFESYDRVTATWESHVFEYVKKAHSTAAGYRYEPHGLMAHVPLRYRVLRPREQFCHDVAHCVFVGGAFGLTLFLVLETIFKGGVSGVYKAVYSFLDGWSWPQAAGWDTSIKEVFAPERVKSSREARTIKCSGGDALSLYSVLGCFIRLMNFADEWPAECAVCFAFVIMCDLFLEAASGGVTPAMLRDSIDTFLRAFVAAGWSDFMIPKLHWLVHFPDHLDQFSWLVSCWVLERKHKEAKRYAAMAHNMTSYASSLLCDAICHNLHYGMKASSFNLHAGLLDAHTASRRTYEFLRLLFDFPPNTARPNEVFASTSARFGTRGTVHVGDVILIRDAVRPLAAEVRVLASIHDSVFAVVSEWSFVDADDTFRRWSRWSTADSEFSAVALPDILCTCARKMYSGGIALVLHPYHVR